MQSLAWIEYVVGMAPPPPADGQPQSQGSLLALLPPVIFMFLIFWFMLIRPQQKKQQETRKMLDDLKEGDNVVTLSGIHGTIKKLKEDVVTLQIAENVRIKINRSSIGTTRSGNES